MTPDEFLEAFDNAVDALAEFFEQGDQGAEETHPWTTTI